MCFILFYRDACAAFMDSTDLFTSSQPELKYPSVKEVVLHKNMKYINILTILAVYIQMLFY